GERRRHGRGAGGPMSAESNRALIQRFYDEGWNANDLSVYDELVTPDFLDHQALPGLEPGREGFKMLNVMFRSAFPAVWVTVDQIVAEDDKVAGRWPSTGTHQGDLFGIPPTAKGGKVAATSRHRVECGKRGGRGITRAAGGVAGQRGVPASPKAPLRGAAAEAAAPHFLQDQASPATGGAPLGTADQSPAPSCAPCAQSPAVLTAIPAS